MTIRLSGGGSLVNSTTAGNQTVPVVATLGSGGYIVAWQSFDGFNDTVRYQRFDAFGKKLGLESSFPLAANLDAQSNPTIAALPNGGFVIAYNYFSDLDGISTVMHTFDQTGIQTGQASIPGGSSPSVLSTSTGFSIGFSSGSLFGWEFDNFLNSLDADQLLSSVNGSNIVGGADLFGSNYVFAYTMPADISGPARIEVSYKTTGTGTITGGVSVVADGLGTTHVAKDLKWIDNSLFVVSWVTTQSADSYIEFAILNFLGAVVVPRTIAAFFSTGGDVVSLGDGTFAIVSAPLSSSNLELRLFSSTGSQIGATFIVSNENVDAAFGSIERLADGRLIVTWVDTALPSDSSGTGIFQQIIDPRDGIVNGHDNAGIAETLIGNDSYNDQMRGFAGNDTIHGLAGADTLYGDAGDDVLHGGRGDDTVYGGTGLDSLYGDLGDDEQYGEAAADTLFGSLGADLLDGGSHTDTANYLASTAGVTINLSTNINTGGFAEGDTIVSIERVIGSNLGDTLTGDILANTLTGNGGADILSGGKGADTLVGSTGRDTFVFALGDSGQTATTLDIVSDYTKGALGTGDRFDFISALTIGGSALAATATQASIDAATGRATFAAGSGTTLADALADITARMTAATNTAGEFAFFQVNNAGRMHLFISDGVAGVTANDTLIQLTGITTVGSINLTSGDLTILT